MELVIASLIHRTWFFRRLQMIATFASVLATVILVGAAHSYGEEEYEKFLNQLKERGAARNDATYFEIAYDYLNYLETTDLVSESIKKTLGYEKGTLLINSAKYIKNRKQRETVLATGKSLLEKFISENEFHPNVPAAKNDLANLLILTARQKMRDDGGKKGELTLSARDDLQQAGKIVVNTKEELKKQLEKIPMSSADPQLQKRRTEFENEFLRARLMLPSIQEEISDTYTEGTNGRKVTLEAAVREFTDVNQDYKSRTAGQIAWIYRGRCLDKLGQHKEAIATFREIFEQSNSPEFRELKRMTLELAFPIWLDSKKIENGFIEAVKVTEPILNTLTPQESRSSSWLSIRLNLAKAYRDYYNYLVAKEEKTQEEKIKQTKALQLSNAAAKFVASSNSDIKREAQQLMVEWGVKSKVDPVSAAPPKDLVEARSRASEILAQIEIQKKNVKSLESQIASNPPNREELLKQLNEANQALLEMPKKAIELLQMAIGFSTDKTPIQDINQIRYQLCFCYYTMKDYFRAALVGEFLLDRFPTLNGSRESAGIAMYSYWDLYQTAEPDNKQFEEQKVDKICSKIVSTWPGTNESGEATRMLIAIAINSGNLDRAVDLLAEIDDNSPNKASIQLNTGQALWVNYLNAKKTATETGKLDQESPRLAKMRDQSELLLKQGLPSVNSKNLNRAKAKSVLSLAKIYAEKGMGKENLQLMENPDYGLLKLARDNKGFGSETRFRMDVFRTALKGYVQSISPDSDAGAISTAMDNASKIMADLKEMTSKMENGPRLMVSLYYSFANDIKKRMDSIPSVAARKNFSTGLADFLQGAANASSDIQVIMWAASTLIRVADSFRDEGENGEAGNLYQAAANVISKIDAKKLKVSADDQLSVLRTRGKALAGQGDYDKAIPVFIEYLNQKPATLDVQIDAALALQNKGESAKETSSLVQAINGGGLVKDPKTKKDKKVIWGWGRLSQALANRPQFKKQFLTARYNLAKTRLLYHQIKPVSRLLDLAIKDINVAKEKYPDLGGAEMKARFESLIQDIKSAK